MTPCIHWSASHDGANYAGVAVRAIDVPATRLTRATTRYEPTTRFYRVHVREDGVTAIRVHPLAHPPYVPIGRALTVDAAKDICEQYETAVRASEAANDASPEGAE